MIKILFNGRLKAACEKGSYICVINFFRSRMILGMNVQVSSWRPTTCSNEWLGVLCWYLYKNTQVNKSDRIRLLKNKSSRSLNPIGFDRISREWRSDLIIEVGRQRRVTSKTKEPESHVFGAPSSYSLWRKFICRLLQ
jgi:hypothetical protein